MISFQTGLNDGPTTSFMTKKGPLIGWNLTHDFLQRVVTGPLALVIIGRQSGQKLQCSYGHPIAINYFKIEFYTISESQR